MQDSILDVPQAVVFGRKTLSIIKQNIVIALGTKLIFLVLAVFGFSRLSYAIATDSGMAIVVILNSLRLFRVRN